MTHSPDGVVDAEMEKSDQFCLYFEDLGGLD